MTHQTFRNFAGKSPVFLLSLFFLTVVFLPYCSFSVPEPGNEFRRDVGHLEELLVGEGVVSDQGDSVPAGVSAVRTRIGLGVG